MANIKNDFVDWFISRSGNSNNYFVQHYNSDKDKFGKDLDVFNEKIDAGNIFECDQSNYEKVISKIEKVIYNNDSNFSEYSKEQGNHRPRAIIGSNNYFLFLRSFFNSVNKIYPLNQILFGPPGTGKTYITAKRAVEIINSKFDSFDDRSKLRIEYTRLVLQKQIIFTTFHQSMSYEDFVEGIKPIEPEELGHPVIFKVVPGILREICDRIKSIEKLKGKETNYHDGIKNFNDLYDAFLKRLNEILSELEESTPYFIEARRSRVKILEIQEDNIITIGEKASTKETVMRDKIKRIYDEFKSPDDITDVVKQIRKVGSDISWTTNYYAVFKALKDFEASSTIQQKESFKPFRQNYVLIIDEINRGNVSQIFGELITLIEEDKRIGGTEELELTLPYSKESFGIPSNLYIIGTMNTSDRSVESLDTALRRRFHFEEMMPNPELIKSAGLLSSAKGILNDIDLAMLLHRINERIVLLLDKDHQIGHSYFMSVKNLSDLKSTFQNKIIPLLQEYFYGDYGKIRLILGDRFIEKWAGEKVKFAVKDEDYISDYTDRKIYKIKDISEMDDQIFIDAVLALIS
jgi:5-methylcytosine-specific restriction enzyme B